LYLSSGLICKHFNKKSESYGDNPAGNSGVCFSIPTRNMIVSGNRLAYGDFPVTISIIVHPRLQISENLVLVVPYLQTSGAIQFGVPYGINTLHSSSFSAILFAKPKSKGISFQKKL